MFSNLLLHTNSSNLKTNSHQLFGAGRGKDAANHTKLMHRGLTTSDEIRERNTSRDFELPFLKFQDVLVATNNFSPTFMIGQGGFGKVYKVIFIVVLLLCFS
jgi:hypothetical protein